MNQLIKYPICKRLIIAHQKYFPLQNTQFVKRVIFVKYIIIVVTVLDLKKKTFSITEYQVCKMLVTIQLVVFTILDLSEKTFSITEYPVWKRLKIMHRIAVVFTVSDLKEKPFLLQNIQSIKC